MHANGSDPHRSTFSSAATTASRGNVSSDRKDHMDIDVAIATEHISLAAAEQGLGSCWVCNFDTDLCRKHFNLPDTIEPAVILTIGYPESPDLFEQTSKKRKTLEEIIKEETF